MQDADLDGLFALRADERRNTVSDGEPGAGRGKATLEKVSARVRGHGVSC